MKALLIDADKQTITPVEIPAGDAALAAVQKAVGGARGPAYVEPVYSVVPAGEMLLVDEEGTLTHRRPAGQPVRGFRLNGGRFVGNGLVIGRADPNWTDTQVTVEALREAVRFMER